MPRISLEDIHDPRLAAFTQLTELQLRNKLEPEKGIFIAESEKVIERALAAGHTPHALLMDERWFAKSTALIAQAEAINPNLDCFVLPHDQITQLTGYELTRGILASFARPSYPPLADVLKHARRIAVLENITNHTNVGAIFRSAAALQVDAVVVTPSCYDPLYRRAIRVSMGCVFQVPWTSFDPECKDPKVSVQALQDLGFCCCALALEDDSLRLDDPRLKEQERLALFLGTEGTGLTPQTIAACDYTVKIPMAEGVDSLNVAAASAVAFWELCRP